MSLISRIRSRQSLDTGGMTSQPAKTPTDKLLVTDILASAELELILRAAGFTRSGSNLLMCSSPSAVDYDGVMALASLGSIG